MKRDFQRNFKLPTYTSVRILLLISIIVLNSCSPDRTFVVRSGDGIYIAHENKTTIGGKLTIEAELLFGGKKIGYLTLTYPKKINTNSSGRVKLHIESLIDSITLEPTKKPMAVETPERLELTKEPEAGTPPEELELLTKEPTASAPPKEPENPVSTEHGNVNRRSETLVPTEDGNVNERHETLVPIEDGNANEGPEFLVPTVSHNIKILPSIVAKLIGSNNVEIIQNISSPQPLISGMSQEWVWIVTPQQPGRNLLSLTISIPVMIDDNESTFQVLSSIDIDIVAATPTPPPSPEPTITSTPISLTERVGKSAENLTKIIALVTAVISLVALLIKIRKDRKKNVRISRVRKQNKKK